ALEDLAALGYEGFETNFASLAHSFADPAPMRAEIEKRGIALIGLHLGVGFFDPAKIEKEQGQVVEIARAVKALGGDHLMLSGSARPLGWDETTLRRKCEELNRAGKACRELGVRLCSHNHTHELEQGGRHLKALFDGTDPAAVSFVLDVGNTFPPQFNVPRIVGEYAKRIVAFHLRDMAAGKEVLMGAGEFDFAGLGRILRELRWGGWLIVEMNRREDVPSRRMVEMTRDYIRKTMMG
ncbi:MAG: TIM barrel protein, partial [Acidobacteria bacterium]|nr:TIM barrel protein [Acidobacteriota bacterium]